MTTNHEPYPLTSAHLGAQQAQEFARDHAHEYINIPTSALNKLGAGIYCEDYAQACADFARNAIHIETGHRLEWHVGELYAIPEDYDNDDPTTGGFFNV